MTLRVAKRGINKQKRDDLRQFGLSQVVTREFLIPVFTKVYDGNETDCKRFIPFLTEFRRKLTELNFNMEELTLVFDKGSNTKKNFKELDGMELPYVATITSSYHADLIGIPMSSYKEVEVGGKKIKCCRTKKEIWGKERTEAEIISAYFGQSSVEHVFRQLKNPYHNAVCPQYHWTDHKIKVHTFICVVGMLLTQIIYKMARDSGFSYSSDKIIDMLSEVRETEIIKITDLKGKPSREVQLEEMSDDVRKLFTTLMERNF